MARHGKALPARRTPGMDDSLLIRSAESLGRMIGSLQRQLDGASKKLNSSVQSLTGGKDDGVSAPPPPVATSARKKKSPARKTTAKAGAKKLAAPASRPASRRTKTTKTTKTAAPQAVKRGRASSTHK